MILATTSEWIRGCVRHLLLVYCRVITLANGITALLISDPSKEEVPQVNEEALNMSDKEEDDDDGTV